MKIYIVAPIYNKKDDTLKFLNSISHQSYKNYQIIIIDDGSTDGSSQAIKAKSPKTIILEGNGSLYWTGAMRKGIQYILKVAKDDDFVLAINNDVTVDRNYLKNILNVSIENNNAIVGSVYKNKDNKTVIYDSGIKLDWVRYRYRQIPFDPKRKIIHDIDTLSTRGALIPLKVIKKIGNFDKRLAHYAADYEYFFRAKKYGFSLLMSPKVCVYGVEKKPLSISNNFTLALPLVWKKYFSIKSPYNLKNHLYLIWKYCPSSLLKITDTLIIIIFGMTFFIGCILTSPFAISKE